MLCLPLRILIEGREDSSFRRVAAGISTKHGKETDKEVWVKC